MNQTRRRGHRRILFGAAALVLLSGCTGVFSGGPGATGTIVAVTLKDFWIDAPDGVAADGGVTFRIYNQGPATHEFVVVRTGLPADELPIGTDGLSVDEDTLEGEGEVGEVDTWKTEELTLPLAAGRYVFFCNLEGHYLGGMRTSFDVTDGDGGG